MLDIQETFGPTIEGEGALVGAPVIYIRTGPAKQQQQVSVADLVDDVRVKSQNTPYLVTITGGEPCLYEEVGDLITGLHGLGHMVKIETRGAAAPAWLDLVDILSISPDLSAAAAWDTVSKCVHTQARNIYLKAGVGAEDDLERVQNIIDTFPSIPLYLFPKHNEHLENLTETSLQLLQQYRWLVGEILHRSWTHVQVFPPAHVLLWGKWGVATL